MLEQLWICTDCGERNVQGDLECKSCGGFRTADAQVIEVGDPDPQLVLVILDPVNGYSQTANRIPIPAGDGVFILGRDHNNPDHSGGRVTPDIDLYPFLTPYIGSGGKSYGVSKFQAIVRRNGKSVTIERYKSDGNPFYNDAAEIKLCMVQGNSLVESKTGSPGEQFMLDPGTVWLFGKFSADADPSRKAPGIAVMVLEETP